MAGAMNPAAALPHHVAVPGARALARLTLVGVGLYVAVDVLLAFLRPGYSLVRNAESDYGRGAWYWVMDANFLLRCALSLALVAALHRTVPPDRRLRAGLGLLVAWALCSGLLAFFADDLEGQPQRGSGAVHVLLALVAFTAVAAGTIVLSVRLRAEPAWRRTAPALLAVSILAAVAYLLLGSALKRPHGPDGLYERIFLGLELLWITLAAVAIGRRIAPH
jgi:hypothetical membrane protein